MASTPSGNGGQYRLSYSGKARTALKGLLEKAKAIGKAQEVAEAVQAIERNLRIQPTTFGEPLYALPRAGLQVRTAIVRPLVVSYGVDQDRRLVYVVIPITPLSSSGL